VIYTVIRSLPYSVRVPGKSHDPELSSADQLET
jgi:hypothetical protein